MINSRDKILVSHAGSLPRTDALIDAYRRREEGELEDHGESRPAHRRGKHRALMEDGGADKIEELPGLLKAGVEDVVLRQKELGVDFPNDGEYGKAMGQKVNYSAWWSYAFDRIVGLTLPDLSKPPGETPFDRRRDRVRFHEAYHDSSSGITLGEKPFIPPLCVEELRYAGQEAVETDIANMKSAMAVNGIEEGFITSVGPVSMARLPNLHYKSHEEFLYACADVLREEYKSIIDAGLVLQIDDPAITDTYDEFNPEISYEEYRGIATQWVEALNYAIRDLPEERIRFHLCWGSWHGPHTTDIPMREIVDVMLTINAQGYVFEAGNVRHEHEWSVWRDIKLPEHKLIFPGVVSHATNVVEHPELVAERILRFTDGVDRERVIAGTDCGLGGRVHPQIAWAKLETLAQGAAMATDRLW